MFISFPFYLINLLLILIVLILIILIFVAGYCRKKHLEMPQTDQTSNNKEENSSDLHPGVVLVVCVPLLS